MKHIIISILLLLSLSAFGQTNEYVVLPGTFTSGVATSDTTFTVTFTMLPNQINTGWSAKLLDNTFYVLDGRGQEFAIVDTLSTDLVEASLLIEELTAGQVAPTGAGQVYKLIDNKFIPKGPTNSSGITGPTDARIQSTNLTRMYAEVLSLLTQIGDVDSTLQASIATKFDINDLDTLLRDGNTPGASFSIVGGVFTYVGQDTSVTNEIQDLTLTDNTLALTQDASTVDLSKYESTVYQVDNVAARDALISPVSGSICFITDADGLGNPGISGYNGNSWSTPLVITN